MRTAEEQRRLELEKAVADLKTRLRKLEQQMFDLVLTLAARD